MPTTASRLRSVLVLFFYWHMPNTDPLPDPETPEWPIAWAAREVLRLHLGPKFDRRLPLFLAKAILERMRLTKWRITKEVAPCVWKGSIVHALFASTPRVIRGRQRSARPRCRC